MIIASVTDEYLPNFQDQARFRDLPDFWTETRQGHASRTFQFEVVLNSRQSKLSYTAIDSKLIERMLDEANVPPTYAVLVDSAGGATLIPTPAARWRHVSATCCICYKRPSAFALFLSVGPSGREPLCAHRRGVARGYERAVSVALDVIAAGPVGIMSWPPATSLH